MNFTTSALILSWVAILLLALVVSGLVRQVHALSTGLTRRPDPVGLRSGSSAPGFDDLAPGEAVPMVLLFLDPTCRTCADALDEATDHPDGVAVRALYANGTPEVVPPGVDVRGGQAALFQSYDAVATPFAVLVDAHGHVTRSTPVGSRSVLKDLFAEAAKGGQA